MIRDFDGKIPRINSTAFISEAAYIVGDVEIGEDSSVWPCAVVRGDFAKIVVGKRSSLEDNCVVHAESHLTIGDETLIGHGAVIHCEKIGNNVLVGNNATLLNGVQIGNFCIIGSGSVVTPGTIVPDRSVVIGAPAEIKGELSLEQMGRVKNGPAQYADLAKKYKKQGL